MYFHLCFLERLAKSGSRIVVKGPRGKCIPKKSEVQSLRAWLPFPAMPSISRFFSWNEWDFEDIDGVRGPAPGVPLPRVLESSTAAVHFLEWFASDVTAASITVIACKSWGFVYHVAIISHCFLSVKSPRGQLIEIIAVSEMDSGFYWCTYCGSVYGGGRNEWESASLRLYPSVQVPPAWFKRLIYTKEESFEICKWI